MRREMQMFMLTLARSLINSEVGRHMWFTGPPTSVCNLVNIPDL
jgi:hypothetical protein